MDGVATLVRSQNFTLVRGAAEDEREFLAEDESRHSIDRAGEGSAIPVNSKMLLVWEHVYNYFLWKRYSFKYTSDLSLFLT